MFDQLTVERFRSGCAFIDGIEQQQQSDTMPEREVFDERNW
jgi:hypothetical protein